jgi:molecular chaperone DnaK
MVKDAEANAEADKKRRAHIEAKNQAESMAHSVEKNLKEHGDKIPAADKEKIEQDLAELRQALEGEDTDAIQAKLQTLTESSMKLGEALYKAQQAEATAGGTASGDASGNASSGDTAKDDGVVDAEFEEVDDNKKK